MITWMMKAKNFQTAKVQAQVLPSFGSIFCQFQPGVADENVAYKKYVFLRIPPHLAPVNNDF